MAIISTKKIIIISTEEIPNDVLFKLGRLGVIEFSIPRGEEIPFSTDENMTTLHGKIDELYSRLIKIFKNLGINPKKFSIEDMKKPEDINIDAWEKEISETEELVNNVIARISELSTQINLLSKSKGPKNELKKLKDTLNKAINEKNALSKKLEKTLPKIYSEITFFRGITFGKKHILKSKYFHVITGWVLSNKIKDVKAFLNDLELYKKGAL
ncbi:MAG: hypothetical protein Q6363_004370, partial [Candidatus Njordarchaeota archaeon]